MQKLQTHPCSFSKILGLALLSFFGLASCNNTLDEVPDYLDDIYPLTEGQIRIYAAVDSNFASADSLGREGRTFYKKELVNGTETDLDDRILTKLWIYESADSTDSIGSPVFSWAFKTLWTQHLDDVYAERTEGNIRYLVMKRPPMEGTRWNGNLYNSLGSRTYDVLNHDTTVTVQGVTYTNCVFILKAPYYVTPKNDNYYRREYAYEIYAPGVGKIVRHDEEIVVQGNAWAEPPSFGDYKPVSESYYLHEEIISHN